MGSFMFLGPTGVGRLSAKASQNSCLTTACQVRIDMSEYMERHSVARLISSSGWVT